ncbi:hypothetical protein OZX57_07095 [Bifidobacterium sp. ESL0682]|uniref:hypothetical protein n=1 Tax=Bifidobacterium sp. ESL0682 TaxID=2983212 RepID=UPI0023F66984|nr:hypothetical protein [Bifidobacterium sp. ESL0682]WEV41730.1 hypothetical protein OZX57_07095 [Bifidobacterium sp. ESL0682]
MSARELSYSPRVLDVPKLPHPPMTQEIVVHRSRAEKQGALALVEPPRLQAAMVDCQPSESSLENQDYAGPTFGEHTVVFLSASGGIGLSALCALTALAFHDEGTNVALVDTDFDAGGLDILLGLENDKGLRFGTLNAPLGRIDGEVLLRRLPRWEGIPVLAFDSWNSEVPEWWEVQAAMASLEQSTDMLLVDGAHGRVLGMVPDLHSSPVVVAVELSVLGLARAKGLLSKVFSSDAGRSGSLHDDEFSEFDAFPKSSSKVASRSSLWPASSHSTGNVAEQGKITQKTSSRASHPLTIVGIEPRGTSRKRGVVSVREAEEYLNREVFGPLCPNNVKVSDALEGLGLGISKVDRAVMHELVEAIGKCAKEGDRP